MTRSSSGIYTASQTVIDNAVAADRARQKAIINSPAAKGREALARTLALQTNLSVESAVATLNAASLPGSVAPEPELTEREFFDWGAAAAAAFKGASRIRSRTSTNAEDDESEDGAAAARRLLGKAPDTANADANDDEAENGESLDEASAADDRKGKHGQPAAPAVYEPNPADMRAFAQGEAAARWAMQNGFGRPS